MKKLAPLLVVVVAIVGAYFFFVSGTQPTPQSQQTASSSSTSSDTTSTTNTSGSTTGSSSQVSIQEPATTDVESSNNEEAEEQVKPAMEAYASSEEALAAVLKGSKDYDDSILEQFTLPDPNCSWCPEFYASVRDLSLNPNTPQEQRAYLAEILAISGRLDNVQALTEAIKSAPSGEAADLYAEALELALGRDDITNYLGEQMSSTNDTLREASVAAVTNQGTKTAAELLIKNLKERGDPEGYYSIGIGLGEFIPDEEAMPVIQDLVRERGDGAALGVKALLNAGLPGVRAVFDELENSSNGDADQSLIKGASDHINIEDGIIPLANDVIARNRSPQAVAFARQIIELSQSNDQQEGSDGEEFSTLAE